MAPTNGTNVNGKWTFMLAGVLLGLVIQGGYGWAQTKGLTEKLHEIDVRLARIETTLELTGHDGAGM